MTLRSVFVPKSEQDIAALVDAYPLAWLVSAGPEGHAASVLPLLVERDAQGRVAALFGHFAKSNPQVALLERQPTAMILAQGPNGYISPALVSNPTWGPTWNYAVARFEVEVEFVPDETHAALERLAAWVERDRPVPWTPDRMGARYGELARYVVAFRATVREVHAAFKLGQDERPETFAEIVAGVDPALGEWMTRSVPR
jgi:transcriptional regulator